MYPRWVSARVHEIRRFIQRYGGYQAFYCGITAEPQSRLMIDHNVHDGYIVRNFGCDRFARDVETYFHNLGCQGSHGGGSEDAIFVYSYKITPFTIE